MNTIEHSISRHQRPEYPPFTPPTHHGGGPFRELELGEIKLLLSQLTQRQTEILRKIVQGIPNKVIAMDLNISQRTVEKHREGIMQRMQVRSLAALVRAIVLYETYANEAESADFDGNPYPARSQ